MARAGLKQLKNWFAARGWQAFDFQADVWSAYLDGESGLIHSATGTGKTLAAWLGPVLEGMNGPQEPGLKVLWITPLRALAGDTEFSLRHPLADLGSTWRVESRTGDTTTTQRARQERDMPDALITTPESLTLMLSKPEAREVFAGLRCVIIDEWHELMSTKRGVQAELGLARLRGFQPSLRTWGVSATLGNLEDAMHTLLGPHRKGVLVQGHIGKQTVIDSVLPSSMDRFPWAGHMGGQMVPYVVEEIENSGTCLVFCNTRAQTEIWFKAILNERPDWVGLIGLHHGSLDREERDASEQGLKDGSLKAVVATSSLDLGVDFSPVDRVIQVGSPKGVARLLQRAGRSGHRPGVPSRVTCVPTHALELIDISAARMAALEGRIESREGLRRPLDVLVQHLVTIAAGEGFTPAELLAEVRETHAFNGLSDQEWEWCMDFVTRGGSALRAYPEYRRVVCTEGLCTVEKPEIAQRHRMQIGTIVSDAAMTVQYVKGGRLGTVEESFLSRLKRGDKFVFAGKVLQFVRIKDMTAWVVRASSPDGVVPRWAGGRLPLSTELASAVREMLDIAKSGELPSPEMELLAPLLALQGKWSALPAVDELLIERVKTREGHHLFFYPVEGRLVHEGLAALFAYRIGRLKPITFSMAANDYGFELLATEEAPLDEAIEKGLLSPEGLAHDIPESLNSVEMARRQFREVARIAGLVFEGNPGQRKSAKQLQASSGLFFDVFRQFDPENLLLNQASREVLERQLEQSRLSSALERLTRSRLVITEPPKPTPMAFPILVDRLRETLSTESMSDRIQKLALSLEKAAG